MEPINNALKELCGGSEIRYRVLGALYAAPGKTFHLRGLAATAGVDPSNTRRLLQRFAKAGLCKSSELGYSAHPDHPLFPLLKTSFAPAFLESDSAHASLDEIKRLTGVRILDRFEVSEVRKKSIDNLKRWRAGGTWPKVYEEWRGLLLHANDAILRHVMTSPDEDSNRLRQSMPYVGLLPRDEIRILNEKSQLDHVLRAAKKIVGDAQFIIIGSQSLHGKFPDLPDELMVSVEVDIIAKNHAERTEWLNSIGVDSPFHESFGYYADPVEETTAVLPKGWKARLVNLKPGHTGGAKALCLEPHDLAISKYVARREKDVIVTTELARRGIVNKERLLDLLMMTPIDDERKSHIRAAIEADFL